MKYMLLLLMIPFFFNLSFAQSTIDVNAIHLQLSRLGGGVAPADFIIEDELGRKTGTDPATGSILREIPRAHYGDEGLDDHETGGPGALWRIFDIWDSAEKGLYRIKVVGISADSFKLHIEMGRVGAKAAIFNFFGSTNVGQITEYKIHYDTDPDIPLIAEHILPVPSQYATIQSAVDAAQAGDVIEVSPGDYEELVGITEKDSVIVRTTGKVDSVTVNGFQLRKSHRVTIKGFVVDATGTGKHGIVLLGGLNQNSDITLEANEVKNSVFNHAGISVMEGNPRTRIVNNRIHSNGRNGIQFVNATGGPHYVVNNTMVSNGWNGVYIEVEHEVYLVNNIVAFNGTSAGTNGGRYGVKRKEVAGSGLPSSITLLHNLIVGNHGTVDATSSADIGNYDQTMDSGDSGNLTTTGTEGTGVSASASSLFAEIFVSETPLDLHLVSTSPAIDAGLSNYSPPDGTAGAIPSLDFESESRPRGVSVDIGADEKE